MKIEAGLTAFSPCPDRFVTRGYREDLPLREQLGRFSQVKGLDGVALDYPANFTDPAVIKDLLQEFGMRVGTIEVGLYNDARWRHGSLTSADSQIRKEGISLAKEAMDVAAELDAADVLLWLGQDGYDYPFEADYSASWEYLIEGIREVASYRSDVNLTIEYKLKEPKAHLYIATACKALLICEAVGLTNVGVVLDLGHALFGGENPAESATILARYGRLAHIHLNDNYRDWDHDLMLGSVHFWETVEFFYWLKRIGYDGWLTIDIWPRREDGFAALSESVRRIKAFIRLSERFEPEEMKALQAKLQPTGILERVWRTILETGT